MSNFHPLVNDSDRTPRRGAREQRVPLFIFFGLSMAPAVALGFGRFAYALLLPSMRQDLSWTFSDAGAMNAANALGYLAGALLSTQLAARAGTKRLFTWSMAATTVSIGATGTTAAFTPLLILRGMAGFFGALSFVSGAALTSASAARSKGFAPPTLVGIYFAGAGIAVALSAPVVPVLIDQLGWRGGWGVLGALSFVATAFACFSLRYAVGSEDSPAHRQGGRWSPYPMLALLVAYSLYGAGYIAYATFIVAYLRAAEGASPLDVTIFWTVLGLASIAGAFIWSPILTRLRGGKGTAATVLVTLMGAAVPLVFPSHAAANLSAFCFGGAFLAVIAAVTTYARRTNIPSHWPNAIAALTVAFGFGQSIGPVLSGAFSDGPTGIRGGLWLSVFILGASTLIALVQREHTVRDCG